jgi:hypothetical protein
LVASLDAPADTDAAEIWDRELARRIAEVDAGTGVVVDRDEFRRRMQARLTSN